MMMWIDEMDRRLIGMMVMVALAGCGDDGGGTGASAGDSTTGSAGTMGSTSTPTPTSSGSTDVVDTSSSISGEASSSSTTTPDPTTGDDTTTDPSTSTGPGPVCGDGNVDPGEDCDDGNQDDTDACTAACVAAACGDGFVQAGVEECDDANQDDTDACTSACKNAACGDGFVGPGELCDDGNQVDDDACSNVCTSASCGDGKTQVGEECDDGNDIDTDACLATCVKAKCGDMLVQAGVEECDDGNMTDLDACSNACKAATCMDKLKNASETDVDCGGGGCPKCGAGFVCGADADCVGVCSKNKCVSNKSCKTLFDGDNTLKDGMYSLDPDEAGPNMPFMAYCDMTHDGGGWTLIMKSVNTNFLYDDVLWENNQTLNPGDFDFVTDGKKAKYDTFMTVGFVELRTSTTNSASSYIHKLAAPVASATALFTGPGIEVNKTMLLPYFEGIHVAADKHFAACNPSTKYVNFGINLKKINGVVFLNDSATCDWNGGARFGLRVNASHGGTGDHAGQGWGTYTTVNTNYIANMTQLLWVR